MKTKKTLQKLTKTIERHYKHHGVKISLSAYSYLPEYGRYIFSVKLKPGTNVSKVFSVADDIKTALCIPLFHPFNTESGIRLAVSLQKISDISLLDILRSPDFLNSGKQLPIALGYNLIGHKVILDLAEMPHAMYAGATGSGKSFGLVALIMSLLAVNSVNELNLILFDIGGNTMDFFEDIPHLSCSIIKEQNHGKHVIAALRHEMERRISLEDAKLACLPSIVCVMDEYVSFINNFDNKDDGKFVEDQISNILRRGRKAKIHMVLATQNPTTKSMRVDINNITSRMAFKCTNYQTSISILNQSGAEKLTEKGAMLYISRELSDPIYVQGAYITPEEVQKNVRYLKNNEYDCSNQFIIPEKTRDILCELPVLDMKTVDDQYNQQLSEIMMWVLGHQTISPSQIKKDFKMGNKVNEIMEKLVQMKLISGKDANKPRTVLIQSLQDLSDDVLHFLESCGYSNDDIANIMSRKSTENLLSPTVSESD